MNDTINSLANLIKAAADTPIENLLALSLIILCLTLLRCVRTKT